MRNRLSIIAALVCALLLPVLGHGNEWSHSADIAKRNLKPTDFPRSRQLAPGVFIYEGLHSPDRDGTIVNTVSLIVTTADGVVVVPQAILDATVKRLKEVQAAEVKAEAAVKAGAKMTAGAAALLKSPRVLRL